MSVHLPGTTTFLSDFMFHSFFDQKCIVIFRRENSYLCLVLCQLVVIFISLYTSVEYVNLFANNSSRVNCSYATIILFASRLFAGDNKIY